jgi:NAD-dependent SIR2 family protein deacetylase
MGELDGVRCEKCGRERYQWHDRGFFRQSEPSRCADLP